MTSSSDLTADERIILANYRKLKEDKKEAIRTWFEKFVEWIKDTMPSIWQRIKDFARDVWNSITGS